MIKTRVIIYHEYYNNPHNSLHIPLEKVKIEIKKSQHLSQLACLTTVAEMPSKYCLFLIFNSDFYQWSVKRNIGFNPTEAFLIIIVLNMFDLTCVKLHEQFYIKILIFKHF